MVCKVLLQAIVAETVFGKPVIAELRMFTFIVQLGLLQQQGPPGGAVRTVI